MLTSADDRRVATGGPVAVVSHRFWRQRFGGADDVLGRQLTVQRISFTIVGVTPPGFFGPDVGRMADVMIPFATEPLIQGRESWLADPQTIWLEIMVRRKLGQSLDQANVALRSVQPTIRTATMPDRSGASARYLSDPLTLVPAATGDSRLRSRFETPLFVMVVAVGLVLLVACANIASLLMARAVARRRELSVRLALGCSRWRIARLLVVESLLLAAMGAALGIAFASWSSALLVQQLNTWENTVSLDLALDWRVLAFTTLLACLSAVVAGVAPVLGLKSVAAGRRAQGCRPRSRGRSPVRHPRRIRRRASRRVARPDRRRRTFFTDVRRAQSAAAGVHAGAAARRGIESSGQRGATRGPRAARRAPARRGRGGARRASRRGLRDPAPHGRRVGRRSGRRWRRTDPSAGSQPAAPLAQRHDTRLVRRDGHAPAEWEGRRSPRSGGQPAGRHRQRDLREAVFAGSAAARATGAPRVRSQHSLRRRRRRRRCRLHDAARGHGGDVVRARGAAPTRVVR